MLFDDLFYPGNPTRREEVRQLRSDIKTAFTMYQEAWNKNANLLTSILKDVDDVEFKNIVMPVLTFNIETNTLIMCAEQIKTVAEQSKTHFSTIVKKIKLDKILPNNWEDGIEYDESLALKIGRIASVSCSAILGAVVCFFLFAGFSIAAAMLSVILGVTIGLTGAFLGSAVIGGVLFVLLDLISSAITGAIERGQLTEAIDALRQVKTEVYQPLLTAAATISGITVSIQDGTFKLSSTKLLWKKTDGTYVIVTVPENSTVAMNLTRSLIVPDLNRKEVVFMSA